MYRNCDKINGVEIYFEILKFSAIETPDYLTAKIDFYVGYPRLPPALRSIESDILSKEEKNRIKVDINLKIRNPNAHKLDSLTRVFDSYLRGNRTDSYRGPKTDVTSLGVRIFGVFF